MELKFRFRLGSVWLLLSCSLQQSLWGILASVPKTQAERCQVSSDGEPVKKVQMIRRIPARCSGWDEAWSWISNVDCRTKYVYDFVELPSAVQKVDVKDCKEETDASPKNSSWSFSVINVKLLAIILGSATVALLVLIGIIVLILVFWKGHVRCSMCSNGPSYTSANVGEQENLDEARPTCNEYTMEGFKLVEPVYEECCDPNTVKQKLSSNESQKNIENSRYQNVPELSKGPAKSATSCRNDSLKCSPLLPPPSSSPPVIPSAPFEEDLQQTDRKCVLNEYNSFDSAISQQHLLRSVRSFDSDSRPVPPAAETNGNITVNGSPKVMFLKEASIDVKGNGVGQLHETCPDNRNSVPKPTVKENGGVDGEGCISKFAVDSSKGNVDTDDKNMRQSDKKEKENGMKITHSVASDNVYHNFEDLVQDTCGCSTDADQDSIMSPVHCDKEPDCLMKSDEVMTEPVYEEYDSDYEPVLLTKTVLASSQLDAKQPVVLATTEPQTVTLHSMSENSVHHEPDNEIDIQSLEDHLT